MIIICNKCSKKFRVDDELIPENGRTVECGYCKNQWFFEKTKNIKEDDARDEIIINKIDDIINSEKSAPILEKKTTKKVKENSPKKILYNFLIIIISLLAILLIVDSFKKELSLFIPQIPFLIDNLYATLHDLQLFLKDLFN